VLESLARGFGCGPQVVHRSLVRGLVYLE